MDIRKIVIDQKIYNTFKNQCFREYPNEFIKAILGIYKNNSLYIYSFANLKILKKTPFELTYLEAEEEIDEGSNLKYLGTIHTHPDNDFGPSKEDWKSFNLNDDYNPHDLIMGISYISIKNNRKFFGSSFYSATQDNIPLIISSSY